MKNKEKLIIQLFIGEVSEILGFDKTLELLKKSKEISNENLNTTSQKTDVISSDFRIVEYKESFRIEKKTIVKTWFYFLGFALWSNGEKEEWNTVLKNKTFLSIRNWAEIENYQFKTKEECLEWITEYNKYPIYHYL